MAIGTISMAGGSVVVAGERRPAILHEDFKDRRLAELEAESTAYIICQSLWLDTSDYSFGNVANWAGGGDEATAGIKASCDRIQKTAATVLRSFEEDEQAVAQKAGAALVSPVGSRRRPGRLQPGGGGEDRKPPSAARHRRGS